MRAQVWLAQLLPQTLQAMSLQARSAGTSTTMDSSQRVEKSSAPSSPSMFMLLSWDSPLSETGMRAARSRGSCEPRHSAGSVTGRCPGSINHFSLSASIIITLMEPSLAGWMLKCPGSTPGSFLPLHGSRALCRQIPRRITAGFRAQTRLSVPFYEPSLLLPPISFYIPAKIPNINLPRSLQAKHG